MLKSKMGRVAEFHIWMIDFNKMFVIRQIFGIEACGSRNATEKSISFVYLKSDIFFFVNFCSSS